MQSSAQAASRRNVVLGVTGGIAAYKSAELCRRLRDAGFEVQVVMTPAATRFVGPLTFQALSGRPVRVELFDPAAEAAMGHIELARWADLVLVAPATADVMARLVQGAADDLLTTVCLATPAPVALAPAMNQQMWKAPATRRNAEQLVADGRLLWGPGSGDQACGDVGPGRMLEPDDLAARVAALLRPRQSLVGRHVVITAGPTREAIDPVRFLSNHSSGKQGFSLAAAAAAAGARVTLISGPVNLATPAGVTRIDVVSAEEMLEAARGACIDADLFIGVAAVADFRPASVADHKIKKRSEDTGLALELVPNPDIIGSIARTPGAPLCVAFAAETENLIAHARAKLERKGVAVVIANDVSDRSIGFGSDENIVTLVDSQGDTTLPRMAKERLAEALVEELAGRLETADRPRAGAEHRGGTP